MNTFVLIFYIYSLGVILNELLFFKTIKPNTPHKFQFFKIFLSWFYFIPFFTNFLKVKKYKSLLFSTKTKESKYYVAKHKSNYIFTNKEMFSHSLRWLKEHNMLYHLFRYRTFEQARGIDFLRHKRINPYNSLINHAITWCETNEGTDFWQEKHHQLSKHIEKIKQYNDEYITAS